MPELKFLNALDYTVIILFLLMVGGVGIFVARYNRRTDDYFKAGGTLPWIISGLSLFVSGFSAFMFVSASGFAYRNGMVSLFMFTSAFGAYWLGYFIFGKLWRRTRIQSPMELLSRRYSQSTTYFYSIISVIPNILLMGALIYTLCIFVSSAFGWGALQLDLGILSLTGFEVTLIGIGSILLLYTVLGGLWAVAVTDTLQFIIIFLMTLIVFPMSFLHLGDGDFIAGVSRLIAEAPPGYLDFSMGEITFLYVSSFWIMNCFGYNVNWHIGQRYYSIADERDTKKMAAFCALTSLVVPILWILPVMVARVLFPEIESIWPVLSAPHEASFVSLCLVILPHGFLGVVVSAILAASMSSADTTFNWLAAVVTRDVFVPVARRCRQGREPSDRLQLLVGKFSVLVIGIIAILVSLLFQKLGSSFDIYMKIYSMTTPALFVPVLFGLLYRKTPWWSAIAAAVAGIAATLIANALVVAYAGLPIHNLTDVLQEVSISLGWVSIGKFELNIWVGLVTSMAIFFLSARWPNTNKADIERLAALDRDLRTPAYGKADAIDARSLQAYKIVALLAAAIGAILVLLAFLSLRTTDFFINLLGGVGAGIFGLFFWRLAARYKS